MAKVTVHSATKRAIERIWAKEAMLKGEYIYI